MKNNNKLNGTHGVLLLIVGGYIGWMGLKMPETTKAGLSSMSMETTVVLTVIMVLMGLAVIGYGMYIFIAAWKIQQQNLISPDSSEAESADETEENPAEPDAQEEDEDAAVSDDGEISDTEE